MPVNVVPRPSPAAPSSVINSAPLESTEYRLAPGSGLGGGVLKAINYEKGRARFEQRGGPYSGQKADRFSWASPQARSHAGSVLNQLYAP
jgi:hypothetical protein